jgi:hypothetical protein
MTTKLEAPLRREIEIEQHLYTLTISPDGLKLVPKGKRNGYELRWAALVSGEAALAAALTASLRVEPPKDRPTEQAQRAPRKGRQ